MRFVATEPVDPRTAALFTSGQIRYSGMQVLYGCCGGISCEHCQPGPKLTRVQLLKRFLRLG